MAQARKLRAFCKWMLANGIQYSDGLEFTLGNGIVSDIGVKALYDFHEGELIATIPKQACLTVKTSGAAEMIEEAQLAGGLGLAVALMYEKSRKERSPWYEYLLLLPSHQALPIVWEPQEIDSLLGTELHAVVQEDRKLIQEDWEECIGPLSKMNPRDFPVEFFTLEQYLSAKTLVASRAFKVDEYHGYGMVPLADLFNHKTAAEDVHLTSLSSNSDSDVEDSDSLAMQTLSDSEVATAPRRPDKMARVETNEPLTARESSNSTRSLNGEDDVLEMILVKNVPSGSEIFNTYGSLSNAALLHRYGFTDLGNPYDIINVDFALVMEYCTLLFSKRHVRNRVRYWRRFGCTACKSQNNEYFEISAGGKPQIELLFLLFIVHLSDITFERFSLTFAKAENSALGYKWSDKYFDIAINGTVCSFRDEELKPLSSRGRYQQSALVGHSKQEPVNLQDFFLTKDVCKSLLWLCNERDKLYGTTSLEEDQQRVKAISGTECSKFLKAMSLRVSERCILRNLCAHISDKLKEP